MGVDSGITRSAAKVLRLDISGHLHKIAANHLTKFPDSLLCRMSQLSPQQAMSEGLCDDYNCETHEYYFERPVHIFPIIMSAYLTGAIHISSAFCAEELRNELKFWNLPTSAVDPLCISNLPEDQKYLWVARKSKVACRFEKLPQTTINKIKRSLWYILEKPASCKVSLIFMVASMMFVATSMVILVMGTVPTFQDNKTFTNVSTTIVELLMADDVCVVWFTLEYLLRILASPSVVEYVRTIPAVVDLISCLPTYIELGLFFHNQTSNGSDLTKFMGTLKMIRLLRILRCFRLIKLVRYSSGLLAIIKTLKRSFKILVMMALFIATVDLMMASLMYFLEFDNPESGFSTIPAAAWWGIVTITTVGYGDMIPTTVGGKLVASVTVLLGIIVIALPVSIVTENFRLSYAEVREEHEDETFSLQTLFKGPWLPRPAEIVVESKQEVEGNQNFNNNVIGCTATTELGNDNSSSRLTDST